MSHRGFISQHMRAHKFFQKNVSILCLPLVGSKIIHSEAKKKATSGWIQAALVLLHSSCL